jgi:hypothetical protein
MMEISIARYNGGKQEVCKVIEVLEMLENVNRAEGETNSPGSLSRYLAWNTLVYTWGCTVLCWESILE